MKNWKHQFESVKTESQDEYLKIIIITGEGIKYMLG